MACRQHGRIIHAGPIGQEKTPEAGLREETFELNPETATEPQRRRAKTNWGKPSKSGHPKMGEHNLRQYIAPGCDRIEDAPRRQTSGGYAKPPQDAADSRATPTASRAGETAGRQKLGRSGKRQAKVPPSTFAWAAQRAI